MTANGDAGIFTTGEALREALMALGDGGNLNTDETLRAKITCQTHVDPHAQNGNWSTFMVVGRHRDCENELMSVENFSNATM